MNEVEKIIEELLSYYKVANVSKLAEKMNTSQARISNWKIRNSLTAVKKKCRELNIYNEIFKDKSSETSENKTDEEIDEIYDVILDNAIYQLKFKIRIFTDGTLADYISKKGAKTILIKVLKRLDQENKKRPIMLSKQFLIDEIRNTDVIFIGRNNKKQLIRHIENDYSNLDCYLLINNYKEILDFYDYLGFDSEFKKEKKN